MTDDRRYGEDEVRAIFDAAAEARDTGRRALTSGEDGLTLAELKEIGREVGLPPERIAEAAAALEKRGTALPRRRSLGMPVSVGRSVDLPRAPTDREWEMLVAELRETFQARGKLEAHGSIRQWTNGNLHAYIEPTESGHRLRLGTLKGTALAMNTMGLVGLGASLALLVLFFMTGASAEDGLAVSLIFGAMGGGAIATAALTLPGWAREREAQMEYIIDRARALIGPAAEPGAPGT